LILSKDLLAKQFADYFYILDAGAPVAKGRPNCLLSIPHAWSQIYLTALIKVVKQFFNPSRLIFGAKHYHI